MKQVDAFSRRLVGYFQSGKPMSVEQVRTIVFTPKKRGYNEQQVPTPGFSSDPAWSPKLN